jgi:hypothetical protein
MNEYREMKERQSKEFHTFPIMFAFSQKQFEEGMRQLGLTPADTDKVYKTVGGGFYRKEDSPKLKEMMDRFDRELQEAIAADSTGDGFIYKMFYAELADHEFGYTEDFEETLDALGYTWEQIQADSRLKHGLEKAAARFTEMEEW